MGKTLSVVMANYNHSRYISDALDAIISQSFRPIEVFICDDASTDNSVDIIQSFVDRYSFVHLIRNEKNIGPTRSANRLIPMTKGEYIYAAAADDIVLPGFFEKSMNLLEKYPQAGLCSTLVRPIDEKGNQINKRLGTTLTVKGSVFIDKKKARVALYKYGSWIGGTAAIFNRNALIECGGFIETLNSYSDGFAEQAIAIKYGVCFIPEVLTCWRICSNGHGISGWRNFDSRMAIIKNVADAMKGRFPADHINKWKVTELFSFKKDKLLLDRERDLDNIEKNSCGKMAKAVDRAKADIAFAFKFLSLLTFFMVKHGKYFNVINKIYYRFKKNKFI